MSTYLSIDLDYWEKAPNRKACTRFINRALGLGVPTLVVLSHEHLLGDVNRSGCNRIEHVDYHSDVVDHPLPEDYEFNARNGFSSPELFVEDGTWLSFVKWRKKGELLWRMPRATCYSKGYGTCHDTGPTGRDPFKDPDATGWHSIRKQVGVRGLPWDDVARVGIAVSYFYWQSNEPYRSVLAKLLGTKDFLQALSIARQDSLARGRRRLR